MTLNFKGLFPPLPELIAAGQWDPAKKQEQKIGSGGIDGATYTYNVPAGKTLWLTKITYIMTSSGAEILTVGAGAAGNFRIDIEANQNTMQTMTFSPALKIPSGTALTFEGTVASGDPNIVNFFGMLEPESGG